jgi:thiamine-phosphate pyrophosphorylase
MNLELYLVTDSEILKGKDFYKAIEDAIKGGVSVVQLREKNLSGREFLQKAMKLRELTKKYNVDFIINDRIDIALICGADGVHIGQSDIDAKYARQLIGKDKIVGVSVSNLEEAKKAFEDGADYIGVGAMYSTNTKSDAKEVSFDTLKEIKENIDIPVVLIGGINLDNLNELKKFNCDGYAVVSAILKSDDIENESRKWIKNIRR